jgi:hypothetical protein
MPIGSNNGGDHAAVKGTPQATLGRGLDVGLLHLVFNGVLLTLAKPLEG